MNKRIEELADECREYFEGTLNGDIVEFNYKKFAQLIVRDIVGMYDAIDNGNKVEGTDDFIEAVQRRYA